MALIPGGVAANQQWGGYLPPEALRGYDPATNTFRQPQQSQQPSQQSAPAPSGGIGSPSYGATNEVPDWLAELRRVNPAQAAYQEANLRKLSETSQQQQPQPQEKPQTAASGTNLTPKSQDTRPSDNWAGGGGISPTTGGAFAAGGGGGAPTAMSGLMGALSQPTDGTGGYQHIAGSGGIGQTSNLGQRILPEDPHILAGLYAANRRVY